MALMLALSCAAACGEPARAPAPAPVTAPPVTSFNGTDVAWLQLMIPMDEQALRLLELVPGRGPDQRTQHLAAVVGAGYRAELDQLRALRAQAGVPTVNVHEGHDMPGMVTVEELGAARQARGDALGRLVAARLREHFEQSVLLCHGERTSGADDATKALAAAIERTRGEQLAQLGG